MTGYTVHTGASKKFVAGWDKIFGDADGIEQADSGKGKDTAKGGRKKSAAKAKKKKKKKKKD